MHKSGQTCRHEKLRRLDQGSYNYRQGISQDRRDVEYMENGRERGYLLDMTEIYQQEL